MREVAPPQHLILDSNIFEYLKKLFIILIKKKQCFGEQTVLKELGQNPQRPTLYA